MDNFRRIKRVKSDSIDGFVRSDYSSRPLDSKHNKRPNSFEGLRIKSPQTRIGNFSGGDGFIARKTKSILPDGRSLGRKPHKVVKPLDMSLGDDSSPKKRRSKKPKKLLKHLLRGSIACLLVALIIGSYIGVRGYLRAREIFKGGGDSVAWKCQPDPAILKQEGDGRMNFLLLGKGGPEQSDGPDLTDTIIVASVDPCNKEAGLLSIPRDLAVKMESGETQKINAVYALTKMSSNNAGKPDEEVEKAGIKAIEDVVENVTGLNINYYAMIDFEAFEKAINSVGGIDINVKESVSENMLLKGKPYRLNVPVGNVHFDGLKALAYSRCRHCDNRNDFGRSERQREIIIALKGKIISLGTFSNPVKVSQLIDSFGSRVITNLSVPDDAMKLYALGQEINESNIKSVSLVDEPNVLIGSGGANLGLGSVQVPKAGLYKYTDIQNFVRATFVDGFIKKENAGVVVYNGTSVGGLASNKANVLKGYGYNVVDVGDAPSKSNASTIIVDLKKKDTKYTKKYLELRYKTTATTTLPDGIIPPENADFVIILGQNETSNR